MTQPMYDPLRAVAPKKWYGVILRPDPSVAATTLTGRTVQRAVRATLGTDRVVREALSPGLDMWRAETPLAIGKTAPPWNHWAMAIAQTFQGGAAVALKGDVVFLGRSPGGFSMSLPSDAQQTLHLIIQGIAGFLEAC